MNSSPVLQTEGLGKSYPTRAGELSVLQDVDLEVAAGSRCAIVGPSGSGKTTLLALCAGLDRPSQGRVVLDGVDLASLDEDGRARLRNQRVGFVFQSFRLIPTLTALENVLVPVELRGERYHENAAAEWLARVGLSARLDHYPAEMSGGEQQRVGLARAFLGGPKVLFADEPTGNLDEATSDEVAELMFELNAAQGTTLILVTHDRELAERCGRVVRLRGGRIVEDRAAESS